MRIALSRILLAPPKAVWPLIALPDQISEWSLASCELLATGDGERPDGLGALRRIRLPLPGSTLLLDEVLDRVEAPHLLGYRVVGNPWVDEHIGRIRLLPVPEGTRLAWSVSARLSVPGLDPVARPLLVSRLERSLDALARRAWGAPEETNLPATSPWVLPENMDGLRRKARACSVEQESEATKRLRRGDPKGWFCRVYHHVTEAQLDACRAGRFAHPDWVLQLVPRFHDYFRTNLNAWEGGKTRVESHWRSAFRAMEEALERKGDRFAAILYGVAKGMQAHIEEDLPRALAELYDAKYRDRCDYARFRADYLAMTPIFRQAGDRLGTDLPPEIVSRKAKLIGLLLPKALQNRYLESRFYPLARMRRRAFERGQHLVRMGTW